MSSTTTYKLIRTGIVIAVIAGSTAACHYKAGEQYVSNDDIPGADSGTRRASTTTMRSDSTAVKMDSAVIRSADSTSVRPGSASKTHPTSMRMPKASATAVSLELPINFRVES